MSRRYSCSDYDFQELHTHYHCVYKLFIRVCVYIYKYTNIYLYTHTFTPTIMNNIHDYLLNIMCVSNVMQTSSCRASITESLYCTFYF